MTASTKTSKTEVGTLGVLMLIVGGILMIYAGVSGSVGIFETVIEYAKEYLGPREPQFSKLF